jgi:hypothetical protein
MEMEIQHFIMTRNIAFCSDLMKTRGPLAGAMKTLKKLVALRLQRTTVPNAFLSSASP